jgi:hypothetical protein
MAVPGRERDVKQPVSAGAGSPVWWQMGVSLGVLCTLQSQLTRGACLLARTTHRM